MNIHIESVKFKASQDLIDFIEKKLEKLEKFYDHIIRTDVTLKLENAGQIKDKIVEVRLHIKGDDIFVKESHKTFEGATESAVDILKRQIIKHKEKIRS